MAKIEKWIEYDHDYDICTCNHCGFSFPSTKMITTMGQAIRFIKKFNESHKNCKEVEK